MNAANILLKYIILSRQRLRVVFVVFFLFSVLLLSTSCGYHFTSIDGIVPQGAKTIAIPVFINNTMEPYVDVEVTKAIVEEFLTDGRLKVVSVDAADLVLRGRVTRFDLTAQAYTADTHVQSYNVGIGVSISIEDTRTQKLILKDTPFASVFTSTYAVTLGDISQTKIAKDGAMKNACKDIASTLRSRVLEGF